MRRRKYPALLAVIAAAILAVGAWLRPRPEQTRPPVSETETARLERLSQRRSLEQMGDYLADSAARASKYLVRVEAGTTGLAWSSHMALAPLRAEAPAFGELAQLGLRAVDMPTRIEPVRTIDPEAIEQGEWVLQVSAPGPLFTPAMYGGSAETMCAGERYRELHIGAPLDEARLGAGIFDLDGNLLGMVVRCGRRYGAIAAAGIRKTLERAGTLGDQLLSRYGMRVANLDDAASTYFRAPDGALVSDVWDGGQADRAGIVPGDVIVALDGDSVRNPGDLDRLVLPVARVRFDVTVLRNGRKRSFALLAAAASDEKTPLGLRIGEAASGVPITEVEPGSTAQRLGIRPGDRLLMAGGREVSGPAALKRLTATPSYLIVRRGDRRFGVLVD